MTLSIHHRQPLLILFGFIAVLVITLGVGASFAHASGSCPINGIYQGQPCGFWWAAGPNGDGMRYTGVSCYFAQPSCQNWAADNWLPFVPGSTCVFDPYGEVWCDPDTNVCSTGPWWCSDGPGGVWVSNPQCSDGQDNDGDGKVDKTDPECYTASGVYDPNLDEEQLGAQPGICSCAEYDYTADLNSGEYCDQHEYNVSWGSSQAVCESLEGCGFNAYTPAEGYLGCTWTSGCSASYGTACPLISAPNACGQTTSSNVGSISCSGICVGQAPAAPPDSSCPVPTVTTNAATSVTSSGATLNGTANPNGTAATGWFRYNNSNPGSCNNVFGTIVPVGGSALGSGNAAVTIPAQPIAGLSAATTYYFCAIASNIAGIGFGNVLSFTTGAANIPPTANAGPDKSITQPTSTSKPTATVCTDTPPGIVSSILWTFIAGGTGTSTPALVGANLCLPTAFNNLNSTGTYLFHLVVTDNQGATASDNMQVTVVGKPNLWVSFDTVVNPASPTAGIAATLNAGVKNSGTAVAGGTFTDIFQIDNDSDHNTSFATSTDPQLSPNLAINAVDAISASYTFASPGTYYVRACADENAFMVGSRAELDENDNCGAWIPVTVVGGASPPPSCQTFQVSPAQIPFGNTVNVTWDCQNATTCTEVANADGFATGGAVKNLAPGDTATPAATGFGKQYAMNCTSAVSGLTTNGILSTPFDVVSPNATITSNPPVINAGDTPTITATCTGIPGGTAEVDGPSSLYPPSGVVTGPTLVGASGNFSYTFTTPALATPATFFVYCVPKAGLGEEDDASVLIKFKTIFEPL